MMKKFLMTGIAALALGAGFTACTDHDFDVISGEEAVVQSYNDAFIRVFGQPAANQTWGFSSEEFPPSRVTRGTFPNANEWAASYKVPDPLTDDQIDIVRQFFQQVTGLSYESPGWTQYFIQQVYKGGTKAKGSGDDNSKTTEKYTSANGGTVVGSDHLDHLEAVFADDTETSKHRDHIFNFNFGDCSTNGNVMDNGTQINDAQHHSDKIQLMVNSTTDLFGYFNSEGSVGHTDFTGLVHWTTIRDWARTKGIYKEDILNDGWDRSFMGFDFEQSIGDDIYVHTDEDSLDAQGNIVKTINKNGYEVNQKKLRYLTYGDLPDKSYIWDGANVITVTEELRSKPIIYNNKYIPMLVSNTNEYCGINGDIGQSDLITRQNVLKGYQYNGETQQNDIPYYQQEECVDLTVIFEKLDADYLPVESGKGAKWVKVQGGHDGYYSDWIVTLTYAEDVPTTKTPDLRVIVEDLNATEPTDFDFNDVVFDVYYGEANEAFLMVLAAGGTLPLTVAGVEVHRLLGYGTDVMINTNARTGVNDVTAKKIPLNFAVQSPEDVRDKIAIKVTKRTLNEETGEYEPHEFLITATTGEPAAKVAVKTSFQWLNERVSMKDYYPSFRNYVLDPNSIWEGNY